MAKEKIIVKYFTRSIHCAQVITGMAQMNRNGFISLKCENHIDDTDYPYKTAILEATYKGKILVFDMLDGYNDLDAIHWYYSNCDYYFKRSFSAELNNMNGFNENKIFPWGFNYHVTYVGNPCEGPASAIIKELAKLCLNKETNTYFNKKVFEERPLMKEKNIGILFYSRLWSPSNSLSEELNQEREIINQQRIRLIRILRDMFPDRFKGGLETSELTKKIAPDLCVSKEITSRKKYLELMHKSDICIGTTGLHNSIGWKMGEYVAAAKGIVCEPMHYTVPGPFYKEKNYLEFISIEDCIKAVITLYDNPERLYEMKCNNYDYYLSYLEPSKLIMNCLRIVDRSISL
jgi:hypothetical protein